jgi:hypothetical protein
MGYVLQAVVKPRPGLAHEVDVVDEQVVEQQGPRRLGEVSDRGRHLESQLFEGCVYEPRHGTVAWLNRLLNQFRRAAAFGVHVVLGEGRPCQRVDQGTAREGKGRLLCGGPTQKVIERAEAIAFRPTRSAQPSHALGERAGAGAAGRDDQQQVRVGARANGGRDPGRECGGLAAARRPAEVITR